MCRPEGWEPVIVILELRDDVFELQLQWRDEMERRTTIHPRATFDQAAWRADRDRMRAEGLYTDHYRGQIPPWVVLPPDEMPSS